MTLKEYLDGLPDEKRVALVGRETQDVRHAAFGSKRVVHAGIIGMPVAQDAYQKSWRRVMHEEADASRPYAVYIHVPFCQTKCLYCGFYQNASRQEVEDAYIDDLVEEIERDAAMPQLRTAKIASAFVGGGTPSSLSAGNAARLLAAVQRNLTLCEDCELTFEGRIHDLVPEKIEAWKAGGVNRVSLGVQSFDTTLRHRVGRMDSREEVLARLALLKGYDMTVIVDLIYGLPGQTGELWLRDMGTLLEAPIDGMDLYQLNVFPDGDLARAVRAGRVPPCADIAGQADLYHAARAFLLAHGVERLSLCHWRRDRRESSLYNTLAKTGAVVYPFGCGAGGNVGGISFMHQRRIEAYHTAILRGEKPIMMMAHQAKRELMRVSDAIIAGLEKGFVDLRRLVMMDGRLGELEELLGIWQERGLMQEDLGIYRLTADGEFWYISMTQSLVECAEALLTAPAEMADENEKAASSALDRVIAEMAPEASADERQAMAARIPASVRMMIRSSSYESLKKMLAGLPPAMRERMMSRGHANA